MRYLSMIRLDERTAQQPTERLVTEMGKMIEEWMKAGTLIRTAGLRPTAEGFRVHNRHGKISVTDGPFAESKEAIGGYAILEAGSREEAVALTRRFLELYDDAWDITCEVRPLDGDEIGG